MPRSLLLLLLALLLSVLLTSCHFSIPIPDSPTAPVLSDPQTDTPAPLDTPAPATSVPAVSTPETDAPAFDPIALAESLTVEERVGQLFLARCQDSRAIEDVQTCHLGGFVLFGIDFAYRTPAQVTDVIASYQDAARIPLLIAVDEEGGTVTRVSRYPQYRESRFPSPRSLYEQGGLPLIRQTEEEKCLLLASLGINVNLAPVCDITTDPDAFLYDRSLGQTPAITADFVSATVEVMAEHGIGSALKHFPGYGNNTDTHIGIAIDRRPLSDLESVDLIPFSAGIEAGCGAIMVSHTFVNCLDPDIPASLSPAVHTYLREQMGYSGVILTDDLAMQAITDLYGTEEAAVRAVLAGNDLLCSSDYREQYAAVLEAVQEGRISEQLLTEAAARVLAWKHDLGLLA